MARISGARMVGSSRRRLTILITLLSLVLSACGAPAASGPAAGDSPRVLAAESFLADIARNVAGDRLKVDALIPLGVDPHGFEPTPADVRKVAESQVLIVNGGGLEEFLDEMLRNAGGARVVIAASAGLEARRPAAGEPELDEADGDPHFWLDPNLAIAYVENIRKGLSEADPGGAEVYAANARAYTAKLQELDGWIKEQVAQIPPPNRKLLTNHESLGYYADRYGFEIVGAILPNYTTGASPSAKELAQLTEQARAAGVRAIFLEAGANTQLARQLADELGITAVTELYTHSVTPPDGPAPTYIDIIRYDTRTIVEALQ